MDFGTLAGDDLAPDLRARYAARPLYVLIENFVLQSIGCLDEERRQRLRALEPRLRATFKREGSWEQVLKAELRLPENAEQLVREAWDRNARRFEEAGQVADPVAFARAFADQNVG